MLGTALLAAAPLATDSSHAPAEDRGQAVTIEELRKGLQQRDAVILNLLQRVESLERQVSASRNAPSGGPASPARPAVSPAARQRAQEPAAPGGSPPGRTAGAKPGPGEFAVDEEAAERALERALVQSGALLLPAGSGEIVPSLRYTRRETVYPGQVALTTGGVLAATEDVSRRNQFEAALTLRLGLPWTSQLEIGLPYSYEEASTTTRLSGVGLSERTSDAFGMGDPSISLTKEIAREGNWTPNLFLGVGWDSNFGQSRNGISLGSGFDELTASLTATKRQDPLVFLGGIQYTKSFSADGIEPGDQYTPSLGMLLAVSPETSLRLSSQVTFAEDAKVGGVEIPGSDQVAGVIQFGVLSILNRGLVMDLRADIGVTDDAPDFAVKVSFPFRFDTGL